MSEHATAMADYTLTIRADSGYESTTEGRCNACQYGEAISALHGKPNTATELRTQRDELLEALRHIEGVAMADEPRDLPGIVQTARAAIAKATGELFNAGSNAGAVGDSR